MPITPSGPVNELLRTTLSRHLIPVAQLRQSEVEELHPRGREHDVRGLDVAMGDVMAMGERERLGHLRRDRQGLVERESALRAGQTGGQRLPLQQLHHEERMALVIADVVHGADVRMGEGRDAPGFALEALPADRVAAQFSVEQLDGDRAAEPSIAHPVDVTHPARAQRGEDFIRTEAGATGKCGHRVRS